MDKICKIINGNHCYILEVDGQEIPFQLGYSADYFEQHYKELGYKIIKEDRYERFPKKE